MTLTTLPLSDSGQKITFRAHGAGAPLVLIHGVGMQSAAWTPQIDHFADRYHVIALDLPGHGGSDPLAADSQLPDYIDWCKAAIEAVGLGAVNLIGHSMGALIAGGVAAMYPALVLRVALLNGVFRRDEAAKAAVNARAAEIREGKMDLATPLARWFDAEQTCERARVASWLRAVDQGGYATAYTAFAQGDATYADRYGDITCPFLAMTGDGDPNSTPAMARAMTDSVPGGQAITLKGHRHMINLTAAEQVNTHLEAWLDRSPQAKEIR
ncbi:(E)-2-((N-methylformamido)methylene)succinate hydrolase [Roseobacter fucihabitans]|uniref:(E)-2-((N-methylformamido)methylene)succinate hydrolase n=1 Tax=Roseobacter fucihabitans TaxID=1537242 RepID=A0ABZ2BUC7_9RHOB|nr:alpha/beta hydrolase [Roseobacter litoralis]MBC6966117.1 Dihydrolipoyllysine-residue acetyltransferase component of acetoin cleaving system [Roseobacter litoralis]